MTCWKSISVPPFLANPVANNRKKINIGMMDKNDTPGERRELLGLESLSMSI